VRRSQKDLIALLKSKNQQAYSWVYKYYSPKMFRLAMKYLKNEMDAQDVVQEVFLTLYERIDDFRQESSLDTWLYRICVNACLMRLRKEKRAEHMGLEEEILLLEDSPSHSEKCTESWVGFFQNHLNPLEQVFYQELWEELFQAGKEMGKARWEAFWLRNFYGYSEKELTEKLGVSLSALKSRLHRSRRFMRKKYQEWKQVGLI